MAEQIRADYRTMGADIEEIVATATELNQPVVLQEPPRFETEEMSFGFFASYFDQASEESTRNFEQLREGLLENEVPVWTFELPGAFEGTAIKEPDVQEWNARDSVTMLVSAALFFLSLPIQFLLRFAANVTGREVFSTWENRLMDSVWIGDLGRYLRESREFDEEKLREKVAAVRDETGKEPLVVTWPDISP